METPKQKIGLIIDEIGDLPEEITQKNGISVVRFKIDYQELADIPGNIYEKMRQGEARGIKSLIKTSQPSISDWLNAFKEKLKGFEEVICIAFSSRISGAYNSALQAKKFLEKELQDRVHVFDSLGGTGSEGLVAIKALDLMKENLSVKEILEKLKQNLTNIRFLAMYKNPKWLRASGRFPSFVPAGMEQAEKMGVRPIFKFLNGMLWIKGFKKNFKDLSAALFEEFESATRKARAQGDKIIVAITHADDMAGAEALKKMVESLPNTEIAFINTLSLPGGGHGGPGAMALCWNQ
jgi:DegV family protein with EDD domain